MPQASPDPWRYSTPPAGVRSGAPRSRSAHPGEEGRTSLTHDSVRTAISTPYPNPCVKSRLEVEVRATRSLSGRRSPGARRPRLHRSRAVDVDPISGVKDEGVAAARPLDFEPRPVERYTGPLLARFHVEELAKPALFGLLRQRHESRIRPARRRDRSARRAAPAHGPGPGSRDRGTATRRPLRRRRGRSRCRRGSSASSFGRGGTRSLLVARDEPVDQRVRRRAPARSQGPGEHPERLPSGSQARVSGVAIGGLRGAPQCPAPVRDGALQEPADRGDQDRAPAPSVVARRRDPKSRRRQMRTFVAYRTTSGERRCPTTS